MNFKYFIAAFVGALVATSYFITANHTTTAGEYVFVQESSKDNSTQEFSDEVSECSGSHIETVSQNDIEKLQSKNRELRDEVEKLKQKIEFQDAIKQEVITARALTNKLNEVQNTISAMKSNGEWSDAEIDEVYPAPFSDFMKKAPGAYKEEYHDFQFEPVNEEWALKLETHIRDFIQLNEYGHLVEISVLDCKSYRCQLGLVVNEPEKKIWKRIFDQMTLEPWFKFHKHYSAPVFDDSFNIVGNFFFMITLPS